MGPNDIFGITVIIVSAAGVVAGLLRQFGPTALRRRSR